MNKPRIMAVLLLCLLSCSCALRVIAQRKDPDIIKADEEISCSEKEEVIYAKATPSAEISDVYVVNTFPSGTYTDYGDYSKIKEISSDGSISVLADEIAVSAKERFSFQGKLKSVILPWNISLKYLMNGKEVRAEALAGVSGEVIINLSISPNEKTPEVFGEQFVLQAIFEFDSEKVTSITAQNATITTSGAKKQVSYIVLPGKELNTQMLLTTNDFEMRNVLFNGVRMNFGQDALISEIKNRADEALKASGDLKEGTAKLLSGMQKLKHGGETLKAKNKELKNVSNIIKTGANDLVSDIKEKLNNELKGTLSDKEIDDVNKIINESSAELNSLVSGLNTYMSSVEKLADGISAIEINMKKLSAGTNEFNEKIADINKELLDEIGIFADNESAGGVPSFVSEKNGNISSVQFVIRTESISKAIAEESDEEINVQPSFWEKLWRLFG
ncbi:MAG: hypothetical protein LBQ95_03680 [Lachnospiraceae bacterium]|jgi:hypothetical protein|nr:hypothetical protein [Lachnospiraceae bacterium]